MRFARARDAGEFADQELEFLQRACVELAVFDVAAQARLLGYLSDRFGYRKGGIVPSADLAELLRAGGRRP